MPFDPGALPQGALFGELYGTAAMRACFSVDARLRALLAVEIALARAEAACGVIPHDAAAAIVAAASDLAAFDTAAIARDTENVGYPIVPLTKQLAARAGDAGRFVHWGATTQDILDTATAMQMRDAFALLDADLAAIVAALAARARTHRDDPMAGRTHLQHAVPITFGYVCALWLAPLLDARERFVELRRRALPLSFGGAVGTLAALGPHARAVAEALGARLDLRVPDAPVHADRSAIAEITAALAVACGSLAKTATDVVLLMQTEVGEVFEPHEAGRGGSSTMPQKRNPIAAEYVIACARGVRALVPLAIEAMVGDHQRSTGPWQSEQLVVPHAFVLASGAFRHARTLAEGMIVDTARMRRNLALTHGTISSEAVAMALAESLGKAEAHHLLGAAVATVLASDEATLYDVLAADARVTAHLDRARLAALLDPANGVGEAGAIVDRVLARV